VIHIDFEILDDKIQINVNVPIEFTGVADCVGVKLGGVIRQVIRGLKVRCYPKDMPSSFQLDVQNMSMRDCKRLKDLDIPNTVRPLKALSEVVVVIAKR
jgi:large subunit ribosomal protein L25